MKSAVKLNTVRIAQLSKAKQLAMSQTMEAIHTDVNKRQIVPRLSGDLQNNSFVNFKDAEKGRVELVYPELYARRIYLHPEYNFNKVENPKAQGEWLKDYVDGGKKEAWVRKTFIALFKLQGGI